MSIQSVKQFWQKVQNDQQLQTRIRANRDNEKRVAEMVKIAAEVGFTFTSQDYEAALKEELARQHAAKELRPEHLAQIAGVGPGAPPPSDSVACCTETSTSCNSSC